MLLVPVFSISVCIFIREVTAMYMPHTFIFWSLKIGDSVLVMRLAHILDTVHLMFWL